MNMLISSSYISILQQLKLAFHVSSDSVYALFSTSSIGVIQPKVMATLISEVPAHLAAGSGNAQAPS